MKTTKPTGQMYPWVDALWKPLGGECPHRCSYCSTRDMARHYPEVARKYSGIPRLDMATFQGGLPAPGSVVFVCSTTDLFAEAVPSDMVRTVLRECCRLGPASTVVLQTKNPERYHEFDDGHGIPDNALLGCTIETNRDMPESISVAPQPVARARAMASRTNRHAKFITIEPIMDFDLLTMDEWITEIHPSFVNIGADSKRHHLPEPSASKVRSLIQLIQAAGIEIREKHNLERLLT